MADGGPLRLGGIDVPHDKHLVGHSDADAVLHAIVDALMGAIAGPDIGELFPDDAAENAGRDSAEMAAVALEQVAKAGFKIANLDVVIRAQQPKLAPFKTPMRERIAELLGLDTMQVGLKAKTGERVGPVGREEALET
ncbi:MAG: 2-C-methyl-D-erythritol 2,4-cyclodiphosphate synthase, partial [Planctomycetales bacterium]|nr:2-C-methyl-D-erythritol 2,4-cyclodiphosphate synthase [Planctomycetales bacterium]